MKRRIFEIISPATKDDSFSRVFDLVVIVLIVLNVISISMSTFEELPHSMYIFYDSVEIVSVVVFTFEYLLRLWTSDLLYPHLGKVKSRLRYMVSFIAIIDLISILPFYLPFIVAMDLRVLRTLRIIRLFRIFKLNRYSRALSSIQEVLKRKASQLTSSLSVILLLILITSIIIYNLETEAQPEKFNNAFSGFWWSIATFTTVGYGDIVPVTVAGKIFSSVITFLGLGLIAVPTGIISAGFVELDNERHEREHELEELLELEQAKDKHFCPYCGEKID